MGTLEDYTTGQRTPLLADCTVGRSAGCWLSLHNRNVSGQHARLVWNTSQWEIRDLGSRNGTFVNGERLAPGQSVVLHVGATVSLASDGPAWVVSEVGPPGLIATDATTQERRSSKHGLLVLPDEEHPHTSICQDALGRWRVESDDEPRLIEGRCPIEVAGHTWWVDVPTAVAPTLDAAWVTLADATLVFAVSSDEEHVELTVQAPGFSAALKPRVHHYMLLTLARARLADQQRGDVSPAECGWLDRDRLCRMLRVDAQRLKVDIFRARKQLAAVGVCDASCMVERRAVSRQLRVGVGQLRVERL